MRSPVSLGPVVAACVLALSPLQTVAGDEQPAGPPPLAVASVASIDRVLDDVDYVFQAAKRPGIAQIVRGVIAAFGDLNGLDRQHPIGAMLLLQPGLAPRPVVVGFVPVESIDDLMRTFSLGIEIRKVDDTDDRYEIITPERTLHARLAGDYAFIAAEKEILNRRFPDPAELTRDNTARYDAATSLRLADVPPGMKTLVMDYLRAQAAADLQQREGESDARFALRTASTENTLDTLERGLADGRELTLGWNLSREERTAALELAFTAEANTTLADELRQTGPGRSRFAGAIADSSPLSLAVSWTLDERARKIARQALEVAREEQQGRYPTEEIEAAATALYDALQTTAEAGHFDLFVQLAGEPPGPLTLIGGMKLAGGQTLAEKLPPALKQLENAPNVESVELSPEQRHGVTLHRITGRAAEGANQRLLGERPAGYIGVGPDALWFAVGETTAGAALGQAMQHSATETGAAPLRLDIHAAPWVATLGSELGQSPEQRELVRDAFAHGRDAIRLEALTSENGLRLRLEIDEGFVRLVGLAIARQRDDR